MKKTKCNFVDILAGILVIAGALNWGLVGAFNFNFITAIFGELNVITRIIYIIVGLAALWMIFSCSKCCRKSPDNVENSPR